MKFDQRDAQGHKPELELIGTFWRHHGTKTEYTITGFSWCGDTDLWMVVHENQDGESFVRSFGNFFGSIVNRFRRIKRFSTPTPDDIME